MDLREVYKSIHVGGVYVAASSRVDECKYFELLKADLSACLAEDGAGLAEIEITANDVMDFGWGRWVERLLPVTPERCIFIRSMKLYFGNEECEQLKKVAATWGKIFIVMYYTHRQRFTELEAFTKQYDLVGFDLKGLVDGIILLFEKRRGVKYTLTLKGTTIGACSSGSPDVDESTDTAPILPGEEQSASSNRKISPLLLAAALLVIVVLILALRR